MLKLQGNLKARETFFAELTNIPLYSRDLTFFYELADVLGKKANAKQTDTTEIGLFSQLIYLYSLFHYGVSESGSEATDFRASLQMPVLLGDLLLGRFYEAMAACGKNDLLDGYVTYIREFSGNQMDAIDAGAVNDASGVLPWLAALANVTASSVATYGNGDVYSLRETAKTYISEYWDNSLGEPIRTAEQAETLLQERGLKIYE